VSEVFFTCLTCRRLGAISIHKNAYPSVKRSASRSSKSMPSSAASRSRHRPPGVWRQVPLSHRGRSSERPPGGTRGTAPMTANWRWESSECGCLQGPRAVDRRHAAKSAALRGTAGVLRTSSQRQPLTQRRKSGQTSQDSRTTSETSAELRSSSPWPDAQVFSEMLGQEACRCGG
jgi:hypothetical protein